MAEKYPEPTKSLDIECPVCLKKQTILISLKCNHLYCETCIDELTIDTIHAETKSLECKVCHKLTAEGEINKDGFEKDLFARIQEATTLAKECSACRKETPIHRCKDCKQNLCQQCRNDHDKFEILKHHQWEALGDCVKGFVDKLVYCDVHKDQLVVLNCKDCDKTICSLCNATNHNTHRAETIESALTVKVQTVTDKTLSLKTRIAENTATLNMSIEHAEGLKKEYEDMNKEIDDRCEELIKVIREESSNLKKKLRENRAKQAKRAQQAIKNTEYTINNQRAHVSINETMLACVQGLSLLHALQSGVDTRLESASDDNFICKTFSEPIQLALKTHSVTTGYLGTLIDKDNQTCSRYIPHTLTAIGDSNMHLTKETKTGFACYRLSVIQQYIWCIEYKTNKIHIYNAEGEKQREVLINDVKQCRSVVPWVSGIMMATDKGILLANTDGTNVCNVFVGDVVDVSVRSNTIYALHNKQAKVTILNSSQQQDTFKQSAELTFDNYNSDYPVNTIQVTENNVYIGNCHNNEIICYGLQEGLLKVLGGSGQLSRPFLCGVDMEGSVLIADDNNTCLISLRPDGSFKTLSLYGLGHIVCAAVDKSRMFVINDSNGPLEIYSINK